MKTTKRITSLAALAALTLTFTACERSKPSQSVIAPAPMPMPTPNAELLQAAAEAEARAAAPWLLIERTELAPAKGTIVAGFAIGGENALAPDRVAFHSLAEPIVERDAAGAFKITFKQ